MEDKRQGYANIIKYLIAGMPKTSFAAILIVFACAIFKSYFTDAQHLVICLGTLVFCGYDMVISAVKEIIKKRYIHRDVYLSIAIIGTFIIGMRYEAIMAAAVFSICRSVVETIYEWVKHKYEVSSNKDVLLYDKRSALEKNVYNAVKLYSIISIIFIILFSILIPLVWRVPFISWLRRAFIILAAACPGAITISVGIEFYKCLNASYAKGVHFKSRKALVKSSKVTSVVFVKVEIISPYEYELDIIEPNKISKNELMMLAAYACSFSSDKIFETIVRESGVDVDLSKVDMYKNIDRKGSAVMLGNVKLIAGNAAFIKEYVSECGDISDDDLSVFVAANGKYAGRIKVKLTEESSYAAAIKKLKEQELDRIILLSSNPAREVEVISQKLGISEVCADMSNDERIEKLKNLRQMQIEDEYIAFVADGAVDRNLIETADVGVCVGAAASVIDADVYIPDGDHSKIADAFSLSKTLSSNIRRNLIVSCILKAITIFLALLGIAGVWSVAILDTVAMVLVLKGKKNSKYM